MYETSLIKKTFFVLIGVLFFAPTSAHAIVYYIDQVNGLNTNAGTASTTAFMSIDRFTENSRSAGDIAIVRRGSATTTGLSTLTFTSDGAQGNPIILTSDYDNIWGDFSSSTQTYTVVNGTTTWTASASITDISVNQEIYVEGDCGETYNNKYLNPCMQAYEVESVSGSQIVLTMPYSGNNAGSGKTLRIMPAKPQRGIPSSSASPTHTTDSNWILKGIDFRSSGTPVISQTSVNNIAYLDLELYGGGSSGGCFGSPSSGITNPFVYAERIKCTIFSDATAGLIAFSSGASNQNIWFRGRDILVFATSSTRGFLDIPINVSQSILLLEIANMQGIFAANSLTWAAGTSGGNTGFTLIAKLRNVKTNVPNGTSGRFGLDNAASVRNLSSQIYEEDVEGTVGDNRFISTWHSSMFNTSSSTIHATTSSYALRSGGGPESEWVRPWTYLATSTPFSAIQLFEYPIYANTSSKQYSMYFMSTSTSAWTTDPVAEQLWIECDMWSHQTGEATSTRRVKRSTEVVDFNGSTAWQSLSVTCQPTQTGIVYLRGWYAKPKETNKLNEFFFDATPVIQ